ncbi:universal stress protein [Halorussus lipolyticus]|uniref:universal stress protein n=1 Tax=Halorussus lipolyticus TaxID=3034024 RepID=UPI0023E7B522|nr:universal stress protein [Halorussus sp. DT80]
MTHSDSESKLLSHVLVPVADEEDARLSARELAPYSPERVTALHVVEKGEGVPDKTPVEQSEQLAEDAFTAIRETFPDADEETAYRRDVVQAILDVADELDASAIAFRPRRSGRLVRLLSGDRTTKLVTQADRPVIALPRGEDG